MNKRVLLIVVLIVAIGLLYREPIMEFFSISAGSGYQDKELVEEGGEDEDEVGGEKKPTPEYKVVKLDVGYCIKPTTWGGRITVKDEVVQDRLVAQCRRNYMSAYDPERKIPLWSLTFISKKDITKFPLTNIVEGYDPVMPPDMQSNFQEIRDAGYIPSRPFSLNEIYKYRRSHDKEKEIAYNHDIFKFFGYANSIIPLTPEANKMKIDIENEFMGLASAINKRKFIVVSGLIYLDNKPIEVIGEKKTAVPTHFYKFIVTNKGEMLSSYIIPNTKDLRDKSAYRAGITDIEKYAGIHLFDSLDDAINYKLRGGR